MDNNSKLINEQLAGDRKQLKETIKYKGAFRIFGQTIDPPNSAGKVDEYNRMGYIIMSEKTYQLKEFTVEQTVMLLKQFTFSNAKLDNGKIIITEHSINRLPVFDMNKKLLKYNSAVMIIGKIIINDKQTGYRVINQTGRVSDLSEQDLIRLMKDNSRLLVNGKIVTRDGKEYISSIQTEFTAITKSTKDDVVLSNITANKKATYAQNNRKRAKIAKLKNKWIPQVLKLSLNLKCLARTYFPMTEVKFELQEEVEFNKLSQVLINEIIDERAIESDNDKKIYELLKNGVDSDKFKPFSFSKYKVPKQAEVLAFAMCQLCLYDKQMYDMIKGVPIKHNLSLDTNMVKALKTKGLYSDILDKLIKEKQSIENTNKSKVFKGSKRTEFTQTTFENSKEIANLGFAINKQNNGIKWSTPFGSTYTLKYIGDLIPNFDEYKAIATTFGDMGVLAQIMRTFECDYFSNEEKLIRVEVMLAIMSLYRPDIVAKFIKENSDKYTELKDMLPELTIDENSKRVDYGLNQDLELYYTSAFNVFLSDYRNNANFLECNCDYSKEYLRKSTYINYRRLGAGYNIKTNILYVELVPIINMITSGRCNINAIEDVIGRLRVL